MLNQDITNNALAVIHETAADSMELEEQIKESLKHVDNPDTRAYFIKIYVTLNVQRRTIAQLAESVMSNAETIDKIIKKLS